MARGLWQDHFLPQVGQGVIHEATKKIQSGKHIDNSNEHVRKGCAGSGGTHVLRGSRKGTCAKNKNTASRGTWLSAHMTGPERLLGDVGK